MLTWRSEIAFGCKNMTCKTPRGWAFYHTHGVRGPFATFCKMFKCGRFEASYLILWVGIYAKIFQVYYTSRNLLSRLISRIGSTATDDGPFLLGTAGVH